MTAESSARPFQEADPIHPVLVLKWTSDESSWESRRGSSRCLRESIPSKGNFWADPPPAPPMVRFLRSKLVALRRFCMEEVRNQSFGSRDQYTTIGRSKTAQTVL